MENGGNPTETARDATKNASGSGDGTSVVAVGRATFGHLRPPSASRNSRVPAVDALPALFHVKCRPMTGTLHRFSRRLEWCVSYYTVGTSPIRNFARLDLKGQKKGEHVRQTTFCVEGRAVSVLLVLYQHISIRNYILLCIVYQRARCLQIRIEFSRYIAYPYGIVYHYRSTYGTVSQLIFFSEFAE